MKARVVDTQADLFEVGVLSQTAEVASAAVDVLLTDPSGSPVVVIGRLLSAERLVELRRLSSVLARGGAGVIVVPPFTDPDLGHYFETPVKLGVKRRASESVVRVTDAGIERVLGGELKIRSDHFFETALAAGVMAVDDQGKPVLIRYQATNTAGPVFFSALQLLTYTALTDEANRQGLLGHLLSWMPAVPAEARKSSGQPVSPQRAKAVRESLLVPIALLLAAGGQQTEDQLRSRATALLGVDMSADDVREALQELLDGGTLARELPESCDRDRLVWFLEERGMHPYLRELSVLLASEEQAT